jgi:hypothetical protein
MVNANLEFHKFRLILMVDAVVSIGVREWQTDLRIWPVKLPARERVRRIRKLALDALSLSLSHSLDALL